MAPRLIETNWRGLAACQTAGPDLFFPISFTGKSLAQVAEAKAVCACCLVRRQCLAFALRTRQAHGIWGGMTEEERSCSAGVQPVNRVKPAHLAYRQLGNEPQTCRSAGMAPRLGRRESRNGQ